MEEKNSTVPVARKIPLRLIKTMKVSGLFQIMDSNSMNKPVISKMPEVWIRFSVGLMFRVSFISIRSQRFARTMPRAALVESQPKGSGERRQFVQTQDIMSSIHLTKCPDCRRE